jgi:two-component system, chemotaxis family, sensor kinase CheA
MSDFQGMEDLLQDFLIEAGDMLSAVDNKLVDLERAPNDRGLLNDIFRGFHTIKGGAGFLAATEMVNLCHLGENLLDRLRNGEMEVTPSVMDVVLGATGGVREMFDRLEQGVQPLPADPGLVERLGQAIAGLLPAEAAPSPALAPPLSPIVEGSPDWDLFYQAVTGRVPQGDGLAPSAPSRVPGPSEWGRRSSDRPNVRTPTGRRDGERAHDNSIRVDTARLDQVLNLSGEIGLTKNRLNSLRSDILTGKTDTDTLHALDLAVSQLDLLVSDLQNAVMKTRMQPIGRLFQKYPRIARDIARQLGKEIELTLIGEETEIDKTMIEDLADPIIHLIRNAVDHGIETPEERLKNGKPEKATVRLEARQEGDHIVIVVADDGRGMSAERLRAKAVEKGLISDEEANTMDERQSYGLIFLPGFSTKDQASDLSGRGVGMDVVKTNIAKLNGSVDIRSAASKGTSIIISLPLTLAILPVLIVQLGEQPFAVPLSMVREILPVEEQHVQEVGGRATMVVRGEVLPIYPLAYLLGWPHEHATGYGVLMQSAEQSFILGIDSFAGREDAVIKSLEDFRPKGVAGVSTLSNGDIVLILDIKELISALGEIRGVARSELLQTAPLSLAEAA